ncbi:MAG: TonB-dependent receptor [Burkholderiaceae bacterium]
MQRTQIATALSFALLAFASPQWVWAQAAQTPADPAKKDEKKDEKKDAQTLEVITVTASKREQQVHRVPYNVEALSEEALREANITDVKKLIDQNVAINAPNNGPRYAETVVVRGLSNQNVGANELDYFVRTGIAYYIDDTPLPNLNFRIKDIARVETLLGPQGTLYGSSSLGGTIRYITNKPKLGKTEGVINFDTYKTAGSGGLSIDPNVVVNLPLGNTFALRASVSALNEKGWVDRLTNPPYRTGANALPTRLIEDENTNKTTGGRVSALWQVTPAFSVLLAHTAQDQTAVGSSAAQRLPAYIAAGGVYPGGRTITDPRAPYVVNDSTVVGAFADTSDRKLSMTSVDLDWDLGSAKLHSATSTYKDKKNSISDITGFNLLTDLDFHLDANGDPWAFSAYQDMLARYKGLTHETRIVSSGDGPFLWTAGLFYTKTEKDINFAEILPGFYAAQQRDTAAQGGVVDREYSETNRNVYKEKALFGEVGYKITPEWQITLGARQFRFKDTYETALNDWVFGGFTRSAGGAKGSKRYYKFNTSYQFTPDQLAYFTISQGWRRGGANSIGGFPGGGINPEAFIFKPDETTNYELGFKGYAMDRKLYYSASVFRIKWTGAQIGQSFFDENTFLVFNGTANGADSHTQGVELQGKFKVTDTITLNAGLAYTEGKIDEDKTICITISCDQSIVEIKGEKLLGFPRMKSNLGLRYSTFLENGANLKASVSAQYRTKTQNPPTNLFQYGHYKQFDASVGYGKDAWEATLYVENLTGERAITSYASAAYFGPTVGAREIFQRPRTMGLQFSYRFE